MNDKKKFWIEIHTVRGIFCSETKELYKNERLEEVAAVEIRIDRGKEYRFYDQHHSRIFIPGSVMKTAVVRYYEYD